MSYAAKWFSNDITQQIAKRQIQKYGHLLNWKNYKEVCLEVGCAEGSISKNVFYPWIEKHIQKLVAVDMLNGMIEFAKEHNSAEKLEYRTVDIMDSKTTKDMKNQYDHIFATCMDHLILDTRSLVSTLHAFLKPEGQLFIITLPDNFFKRGLDKQFQNEKWIKYKPKQPLFTEYTKNPIQYLTTILQNTGFEVNKCEYDNQFYTTNDLEGFTRALIDMYLQLELLSADLLDDFSADLVQECKKQCKLIAEPNKYDIPINVVTWIATKTT